MREPNSARALEWAVLAIVWCMQLRAADITIRLINGKTGRPMSNTVVGLAEEQSSHPGSSSPQAAPDNTPEIVPLPRSWEGRTDAEGKVTFHIADPPGTLVGCFGFNLCQRHVVYYYAETAKILGEGVLSPSERCDPKGKLKGRFSPKPGEWVVFGTPFAWWQTHLPDIFGP